MNIYHLKYFIDAAKFGSISLSAKANFVSHSAVSQAIKSLENHFDVNLVFHSKRLFQLTPEGELCRLEGEKHLANLDSLKQQLQTNTKEIKGHLHIWAPQSLIVDSLYKSLEIYRKKYPLVKISISPGAAAQVRNAILTGDGEIGILIDDGHLENFSTSLIRSGDFVIINSTKKINNLEKGIIVTSKEKIEVRHLAKGFKSKFKKDLNVNMEVMSWGVIKNLVEKGFGCGYVPDYCVSKELSDGRLAALASPKTPFKYQIKAIWPKNKKLHPNAALFVQLLKEHCGNSSK